MTLAGVAWLGGGLILASTLAPVAWIGSDFEVAGRMGLLPAGWFTVGGRWQVVNVGGNHVLQQTLPRLYENAFALTSWADYEVRAEFRVAPGADEWGAGVVAYWQGPEAHYRLVAADEALAILRVRGEEVIPLGVWRRPFRRAVWYRLRFRLENTPRAVRLWGKVWPADAPEEPTLWLETADPYEPLRYGSAGLWTGHCDAAFAQFALWPIAPAAPTSLYEMSTSLAKGQTLPGWVHYGGAWEADVVEGRPVYRQMCDRTDWTFNDNALTVVQWQDYEVEARVQVTHPEAKWGVGLTAYYSSPEHHYRLRILGSDVTLTKKGGTKRGTALAEAKAEVAPEQWYHLRLQVRNRTAGVVLRGCVWPEGEAAPPNWTVTAFDADAPLRSGLPGTWAFGCQARFDDFRVLHFSPLW